MSEAKNLIQLITNNFGITWFEIAGELWKVGRKVMRGLANEGMYEVLDYDSTLEIHDRGGKKATYHKRMKIRYLQDDIVAFHDYGWGDGDILLNYKTSRGRAVDRYRSGYKTYILLSLREVRNKGDIDEYNISWDIRNGFLLHDGYWATTVSHRMRKLRNSVIFPKSRLPQRIFLEESNRRQTHVLGIEHQKRLADGRLKVTWETKKPKLYELYTIRWDW
ncbi:MAG: hypothetical protein PVF83_11535 [Anaerolineales bacterium]|jgi:hypothetical protein